jgi:uncharacterized protein YigE (DUF2233 family)
MGTWKIFSLVTVLLACHRTSASSLVHSVTYAGARFDVVEVPLDRYELQVHTRAGGLRLKDAPGLMRTNAGIFEPGFVPTGLLVASGTELHPLNAQAGNGNFYLKPNGVFAIRNGAALIEETSRYSPTGVNLATQSGPLLLERGKAHPAFRADSTSRLIRSAVGVRDGSHVVFVISRDPVNFWTLAQLFRDELGCADALYLDGTISALWTAGAGLDAELDKGPFAAVLSAEPRP